MGNTILRDVLYDGYDVKYEFRMEKKRFTQGYVLRRIGIIHRIVFST